MTELPSRDVTTPPASNIWTWIIGGVVFVFVALVVVGGISGAAISLNEIKSQIKSQMADTKNSLKAMEASLDISHAVIRGDIAELKKEMLDNFDDANEVTARFHTKGKIPMPPRRPSCIPICKDK
jgi:hypothetical protein